MMKFKKLASVLALTIALAQVVTVVPVHAEEVGEVTHEADTSKWSEDEYSHWNPCVVEGCTEHKYNEGSHSDWYDSEFTGYDEERHTWECNVCGKECSSEHMYLMIERVGHGCSCGFWLDHSDSNGDGYCDINTEQCNRHLNHTFTKWEFDAEDGGCWSQCDAESCYERSFTKHSGTSCSACGWKGNASTEEPKTEEPKKEEPAIPQKSAEEVISEALAKATEEIIRTEEAMPVTSFVSAEAIDTLPAEVTETSATETVYNLSKITTTRGFISAVDKIVKANTTTEAVSFYSSNPIAFNADSLTALTNANTEFVYMFNHNGHLYKVTIPAGAKVDLAGQTFAGPLYIGAQLGTSVLVK